jgi:hypothetical protein
MKFCWYERINKAYQLKKKPANADPQVDKKTPEVILKAEWVFHPKY